jgi:predicted O-linked N-acetylglucosamine transferase (SPINDLY family)
VQVTWLGYPGTSGLATMDYRITDPYLDPPDVLPTCYTEKSLRMPDSFWCYPIDEKDPTAVNALPAVSNGYITFGSLNGAKKVNTPTLTMWARVLSGVPNSHLLMLAPEGEFRMRTIALLGQLGIASDRLRFIDRLPREKYMGLYNEVDIVLDPYPYSGHTTTFDSMWMGVPVVTLAGETVVSRGSFSALSNVGLGDLAGRDADAFVKIAVALANDLPRLGELRRTLRDKLRNSPAANPQKMSRSLETAYRQIWKAWATST